jgi:hypothetical protein
MTDEVWEAVRCEPMTDEQIQLGKDLIRHAMDKIEAVVAHFLQFHDNPQQVYMLNVKVLKFFMQGQALFDIGVEPGGGSDHAKRDRILVGTLMPLLMVLAENGADECGHIVERIGDRTMEPDHREILRFLAQL